MTMKRSDIRGFTLCAFGYSVEVVTVHHIPRVIAFSRGVKTIWRVEV